MKEMLFLLLIGNVLIGGVYATFTLSFPNGTTFSDPYTLTPSVNYVMNITFPTNTITAGSTVAVQFGYRYNITASTMTNCQYSTSGVFQSGTCAVSSFGSGTSTTYIITYSGIYPNTVASQASLNLKFTITNPWGGGTGAAQNILVSINDASNNVLGTGQSTIQFWPSVMSSCSLTSSSLITGANSSKTISFTPTVPLIAGSTLQVTMPLWFNTLSNAASSFSCSGITNSDSSSLTCNKQTFTSTQAYTLSGFVTSDKTLSTAVVLEMNPLRNPWNTYPFGPITYQLINSGIVTQNCTGFSLTMTTPNTFTSVFFSLTSSPSITTAYNSLMMRLQIKQPFPSTGYIRITFPSTVSLSFVGSTGSVASQNSTQMILSSVASTDLTSTFSFINLFNSFNVVTPPHSRPFTFTFTSLYLNSGTYYPIDSSSYSVTPVTSALTGLSVIASSQFINDATTYTVKFTTTNALTSGSFVGVIFPSTIAVANNGSCSADASALSSCSIVNNSYVNFTSTGDIAANTSITLTFDPVTNPDQLMTTASIQISTYYDYGLDSMVDTASSGLTITTQARSLTNVTITPVSLVTYATTNYDVAATLLDPIPSGGSIKVTFDSAITIGSVNLVSASFSTASCTVGISGLVVTLIGCFPSGLSAGAVTFTLSGLKNPPSIQPTTSLVLQTAGISGTVNYINSGLILTMTTPATTTLFTLTPSSLLVHATTTYTLRFTFAVPHISTDYFTFSIDPSMSFVSLACTPVSGISSVSCATSNATTLVVTFNNVPQSTAQISIASIVNYDVSGVGISFKGQFYNSGGYAMETTSLVTQTYTAETISSITVNNNDQIALYEASNLTLTISTPFALHSSFDSALTQLVITLPTSFSTSANTTCLATSGTCSLSNTTFTVIPVGRSLSSFSVVLGNVALPFIAVSSTSFIVNYQFNGSAVASVSSGVTVSAYCTSPCQRCISVQTACASCLPSPNTAIYLFSSNSSCLPICPATYYPDTSNICQSCISPCAQCLDSVNCSSCAQGRWLYQTSCVFTCPNTYYNASNGNCQSCVSPCDNCLSTSTCTSCRATFYYYNNSCVVDSSCPSGTFANSSSNTCESCVSPCATCHYSSGTTCQSCAPGYIFHNSTCLQICPDGYYNNSGTCAGCVPPCGYCTSATFCTTCLTNYLNAITGQCVTSGACPDGTYPNSTTNQCVTCPTGCTACSSSTVCSACNSTLYVFYNFQCLVTCPNTTYQSGVTCQDCSPSCATCITTATTCTSCTAPQVLQGSTCAANCNNGYYNSSGVCSGCMPTCSNCSDGTTCDSCPLGSFLSSSQCVATCPGGSYADNDTRKCIACTGGCSTCSGSAGNCTSCPPGTVLYNGSCQAGCPSNYFNISGQCITCSNCINCTSSTTCSQCQPGYYLFYGVCYASCPGGGIADPSTMTCTPCDSSCLQCSGTITNCTSCKGGTYLYTGSCFSNCPTGLVADASTNSCKKSTLGNIVYFPCSITFLLWAIVLIYSKCNYPKTQMVTGLAAGLSITLWCSWLVLIFTAATNDINLQSGQKSTIAGVGLMGVLCSLILGIVFNVWVKRNFVYDSGFDHWKERNHYNLYSYRIIAVLSGLTLPFFRMVYSRFFCRNNFSAFFINGADLFLGTNWFTAGFILFSILPLIFCCGYLIYLKQNYDQTLIYSIDTLLLSLVLLLLLIIDISSKDESFFDEMIDQQPYLRRLKYNNLDQSISCLRFLDENNKPIYRSDLGDKEKEDFFRKKVNCVQNVNKFGHLNEPPPQPAAPPRRVKTLPDDLSKFPQLNPYDDDDAINSEIWKQELESRRLKEEQEQNQRKRKEEEQRLKRVVEEEEQEKKKKVRRMLEDEDEQQELQFPDLAAIEKAERKDEKSIKNSRTMLLNNFKKVEDKPIDAKAIKKLQDMSRKNGLDPSFMSETFGVQKHHNPELLNAVIDKHNHVNRQAVKNLFSSSNNPQILQSIFSKNSQADPQRMRQLLNDPESANIIKKLADKEEGIVSANIANKLLDKNSKYSTQFVKKLLSDQNGMDPQKLKKILRDNPDPVAQEATLKALKKIGGNDLQNKKILQNMLGDESKLTFESFVRVANDLPKQIIEQFFGSKSEANDKIITSLLNNPKINLKKLAPILQDPQIALQLAQTFGAQADSQTLMRVISDLPPEVINQLFGEKSQTNDIIINQILKNKKIDLKNIAPLLADPEVNELLAVAISHENPAVRENILNLLKNGQKIDPTILKQMLSNPKIVNKLLTQPIDPAFLSNLLGENAKTDLKLLEKSLNHMEPEQIAQAFGFHPEKNIDFQKMAQLFQSNSKSDPKLIAQLLEPEMVASLYSKNNDTKAELLNKLVEKGKKINSQEIMKIYGEDSKSADKKYLTDHKYNVTDSNFNLLKGEQQQSQLGFIKKDSNAMSRTDGVAGFLSPIHVSLAKGKNRSKAMRNIDDLSDEQVTQYQDGEQDDSESDDQYQEVNGVRRKKRRRPKKKLVEDIRLPSEQIYLQRLEAPHQLQKKKNLRKKKKRTTSSMQQLQKMDEQNEIYDLDF